MGHAISLCMTTMLIYWRKYKYHQEEHGISIKASKEDVLEVKADKTKYTLMSCPDKI
jgi:hypothetical protein